MRGVKGRNKSVFNRYVCYTCFKRVNECTCEFYPPTSLIMIDEAMQDIVRIMNEKGFRTMGCCESHYKGVCQCIYVAIGSFKYEITTFPEGFVWNRYRHSLAHEYKRNISKEEFEAEKAKYLKILREWVDTL